MAVVVLVALAAVYFVAGKLGLALAFVHPSATAVWPPTGIALAAFLILGARVWPAIFVGAFLVNLTTAGSVATALGIGTGNTLEGLVGAYLVRRFANGRQAFEQARSVFVFVAVAAIGSTLVAATVGVTSLALAGFADWRGYGAIWLTWWLGDMAGDVIVAPLVLVWAQRSVRAWSRSEALEAGALLGSLVLVGGVVFGGRVPWAFLCIPVLLWAAFRFDQRTAATAIFVLSVIAIWGTLRYSGPFVRASPNESLLILQAFLGICAVMTLALAAVVSERRAARQHLEERVAERTRELTDTGERLRDAQEALVRREKLAMLGQLAGGVSHELRNPLGVMTNAVSYLDFALHDAPYKVKEYLGILRGQIALSERIVSNLLDLTRVRPPQHGAVSARQLVDRQLQRLGRLDPVQVCMEIPPDLPLLLADEVQAGQVVLNLLTNALQAMGRTGGTLTVRAGLDGARRMRLDILDTGPGIPPDHLEKIFEPLFTTKTRGLGLGLAVSRALARANDGDVTVASRDGEGAAFTLVLPTVAQARTA